MPSIHCLSDLCHCSWLLFFAAGLGPPANRLISGPTFWLVFIQINAQTISFPNFAFLNKRFPLKKLFFLFKRRQPASHSLRQRLPARVPRGQSRRLAVGLQRGQGGLHRLERAHGGAARKQVLKNYFYYFGNLNYLNI